MRKISSNKSIVQLIKFILGKFISSLGNSMYNFGISFYILSKTGSAKLFSINLAIMIIVNIITTPLSGYIADAGNKKKIIVCSQIGQSIFMFILLLTIYIKGFSIICILVTNIAITFLNALSTPSLNSTLPNIVHPNYLQKINAYYNMTNSITTLIGPIIGGVIYTLFNVKIIIVLFIISFIISGIIDMSINFSLFKKDIYNTRNLNGHIMKNFNYGLKYIKGKIVVFRLIILSMISNFFSGIILVGISKLVIEHFKAPSYVMGSLEASFGAGLILGGIIIGTIRKIKQPLYIIKFSLLLYALIYISIGIIILLYNDYNILYFYLYILSLLMGGIISFINIPIFVYFQENISEHVRGRIFSVIDLLTQLLIPLSYIISGFLFDTNYYSLIFLTSGFICLFLVLLILNSQFIKNQNNHHSIK
ncbi:MFS transporter [Staphylococcus aureus]|uniref:Major facilitator family transporter n=3 Tax=Staphylococcus aureus TaxID=1280 RepID=A0A8G2M9D5_STAAU|nr:MFS transporter [Staphylococcus aureus]EFB49482.1 predicted protein [Staphylococcus aureus subsp. aureus D139]MCB8114803.1 MFS transporter [Staphylococcus aureus]MCM0578053.1 MFS transporter [Staphylococcus aureus]MCM0603172.1 MFS transporter [Staphylococcus aureus]MCS4928890.1 MFS transporter [Staphylococcus aureus]